ncbi:MAG: T9SS type A sorting domain-containing protein, partial [Bacteroidia bacterium]
HNHPYPNGMGFKLTYTLGSEKDTVDYSWTANGDYTYKFITPAGTTTSNYKGQALCKLTVGNKNISASNSPYRIVISQDKQITLQSITTSNPVNVVETNIYNLNGARVYQSGNRNASENPASINAANWAPGAYFYKTKLSDGNSITLKFILP